MLHPLGAPLPGDHSSVGLGRQPLQLRSLAVSYSLPAPKHLLLTQQPLPPDHGDQAKHAREGGGTTEEPRLEHGRDPSGVERETGEDITSLTHMSYAPACSMALDTPHPDAGP